MRESPWASKQASGQGMVTGIGVAVSGLKQGVKA